MDPRSLGIAPRVQARGGSIKEQSLDYSVAVLFFLAARGEGSNSSAEASQLLAVSIHPRASHAFE